MADTQRTRNAILTLFADNVTGQISAQDLRDYVVTVMEQEFANAGDFWAQPSPKYTTTDKTARGWKKYSQYIGSDCSFMNVLYVDQSTGYWMRADVADSLKTGMVGLAMDSYTAGTSTGTILMQGEVYDSSFSATFSGNMGRVLYLASGSPGSVTLTQTTLSELIIGAITPSDDHGGSAIGKWFFKPEWAVRGV